MNPPTIADKKPAVLELTAGSRYWCACGQSKQQPFCDGAHKGSGFVPLEFTLPAPKRVALCQCKRTGNPPYCDGAHKQL